MNKQIIRVLRILHSEASTREDEFIWHTMLPLVEKRLNDVPRRHLRFTPREVFTNPSTGGRGPIDDAQAVEVPETEHDTVTEDDDTWAPFIEAWKNLHRLQSEANTQERDKEDRRRAKCLHQHLPCFLKGDWVLMARRSRQRGEKLIAQWWGPYRVLTPCNDSDRAYVVEDTLNHSQHIVHISRLLFYCEASRTTDCDMEALNNTACILYDIDSILAIDIPPNPLEASMLVHWKGFEDEDDSWLFCRQLARDVPEMFVDALVRFATQLPQGFIAEARAWLATRPQKAYLDAVFSPSTRRAAPAAPPPPPPRTLVALD
eukprot:GHVU01203143.1.p1 GENE.GHVU01203143.1~~GHVU01203143.1.p1  ORF type:complete len:317 (-),score=38.87 GHVU01203143.1:28-978(-)